LRTCTQGPSHDDTDIAHLEFIITNTTHAQHRASRKHETPFALGFKIKIKIKIKKNEEHRSQMLLVLVLAFECDSECRMLHCRMWMADGPMAANVDIPHSVDVLMWILQMWRWCYVTYKHKHKQL
jgi:hypothetical protein